MSFALHHLIHSLFVSLFNAKITIIKNTQRRRLFVSLIIIKKILKPPTRLRRLSKRIFYLAFRWKIMMENLLCKKEIMLIKRAWMLCKSATHPHLFVTRTSMKVRFEILESSETRKGLKIVKILCIKSWIFLLASTRNQTNKAPQAAISI